MYPVTVNNRIIITSTVHVFHDVANNIIHPLYAHVESTYSTLLHGFVFLSLSSIPLRNEQILTKE